MSDVSYSVTPVTYESGGIKVNALLYKPTKLVAQAPSIVHHPAHRCAAKQYEWYLGKFAEAGYVGLSIEQRGYGSGPEGQNDRGGELQQGDIMNGISYVEALPFVDPDRIGVSGHSNGAALALIVAAKDARVRACISLAPKTDWVYTLRYAKNWKPAFYKRTILEISGGISPEEDPAPYVARSPITYANRIRVPVFLSVGTYDWVNPTYHCVWMQEALNKNGNTDTEVSIIEEVDHWFCRLHFLGYCFDEVTEPAIRWFDRFVKEAVPVRKVARDITGVRG